VRLIRYGELELHIYLCGKQSLGIFSSYYHGEVLHPPDIARFRMRKSYTSLYWCSRDCFGLS
jgi:hypothetical protein